MEKVAQEARMSLTNSSTTTPNIGSSDSAPKEPATPAPGSSAAVPSDKPPGAAEPAKFSGDEEDDDDDLGSVSESMEALLAKLGTSEPEKARPSQGPSATPKKPTGDSEQPVSGRPDSFCQQPTSLESADIQLSG